jgi:hypothetical protein
MSDLKQHTLKVQRIQGLRRTNGSSFRSEASNHKGAITLPRFYFDVLDGDSFSCDDEGLQLESLNVAEDEAILTAVQIGRDCLPKRLSPELCVRVRDEHGQPVLTVAVSMMVRRIDLVHA